jgi:hypothetical protein
MITSRHKPWIRFTLSLLALALIVGATGCKATRDEKWHCYDREGKPIEGAIVICSYNLAGSGQTAVNYRISDAKGKIFLDLDEDTPDGLIRDFSIYSPELRSGGPGERWHKDQPIPDTTAYFDEWNNKIYLKSGVRDPLIWHEALNNLISSFFTNMRDNNGGAKLQRELGPVVARERSLFLEQYGEQVVSPAYLENAAVNAFYPYISKQKSAGLKFKDITLSIPPP